MFPTICRYQRKLWKVTFSDFSFGKMPLMLRLDLNLLFTLSIFEETSLASRGNILLWYLNSVNTGLLELAYINYWPCKTSIVRLNKTQTFSVTGPISIKLFGPGPIIFIDIGPPNKANWLLVVQGRKIDIRSKLEICLYFVWIWYNLMKTTI